ncbi:MAG: glycosyltransferase family 4 protein [Chloroflexota bacterium]|nr:glycosyltransferase family 4 protein [Chloroflexota bacterium]
MALRVLIVDRAPPASLTQGNALIGLELFRRLSEHELTLVCPSADPRQTLADERLRSIFRRTYVVERKGWTPAISGWMEGRVASVLPLAQGMMGAAGAFQSLLARLLASNEFDVVHTRQLPMSAYTAGQGRGGRLLELIDSETLGAERATPRTWRTRSRSLAAAFIERQVIARYDVVTTVAEADAARLRALARGARIEVVPNGVDADRFTTGSAAEQEGERIVFVGAMSYAPNVAAVNYFARQVLPLIRSAVPNAHFVIVGRDPAPSVLALAGEGVEVTGEVEDVRPHMEQAAVVVVPMQSGSGIKNKVLEALAMERAVVATPLAVEGIAATPGEHLVVASGARQFADGVLRLLADPGERRRLGRAGRGLVTDRYTWDACAARYEALWYELAELRRDR